MDYSDVLPQTKRKLTKKEAKMKREEQWLNEDDNASEEVKKVNKAIKDISKVNTSCGIANIVQQASEGSRWYQALRVVQLYLGQEHYDLAT